MTTPAASASAAELALLRHQLLALGGQVGLLPVVHEEEQEIRQHLLGVIGALGRVVATGRGEYLSRSTLARIDNATSLLAALLNAFGHPPSQRS